MEFAIFLLCILLLVNIVNLIILLALANIVMKIVSELGSLSEKKEISKQIISEEKGLMDISNGVFSKEIY